MVERMSLTRQYSASHRILWNGIITREKPNTVISLSYKRWNTQRWFSLLIRPLVNMTKVSGEGVRLRCEVTGEPTPIKFRWFKNEAPLLEEKGRVLVRRYSTAIGHGSRVRIVELDTHDTGYYRCEASTPHHLVDTTGILVVKMGRRDRIQPASGLPNMSPIFPNFPNLAGRHDAKCIKNVIKR
uniref:Ig-like domain-containing protein n=1 Tax=Strigamia maritima TaxID=126957 RepID=T1IWC3_STRMM